MIGVPVSVPPTATESILIDELWLGLFHSGNQAIRSNDIYEGREASYTLLPAVIMNVPPYLTIEMSNIILEIMPALTPLTN